MKTRCISDENAVFLGVIKAFIALAFAVVIQSFLTAGRVELPQKNGESLFSLISDDTRLVLSSSMMQKTDDYFHGGVRVADCTLERHAAEELTGHHDHDHSHAHHQISALEAMKKPFLWINSQIHAQDHRHLKDERSVELLPWVSAAVMLSPHNIQAYESGSYILNRMTEKPELAITLLKQGISNNTENVSLELSLSELYFNNLKDRKNASVHLRQALEKSLAKKGKLTEDDIIERLKIYFYLGAIANDNHDIDSLKSFCRSASEINPDNVRTLALVKWLHEEQKAQKE